MTSTVGQTNHLLEKAERFYWTLRVIEGKLETLNDLQAKARTRTEDRLDRLEDEPSWMYLFEEENIGVERSKKNLQLLDRLQPMISNNLDQVGDLINELTRFKARVGNLQKTASSLAYSPSFSIEEQKRRLKQSIQDLTLFKQRLINKQKN